MLVCKFGGSSLADAACFRRVGEIIASDSRRRVIVVSAPGKRSSDDSKVTDLLLRAAHASGDERERWLDAVTGRFGDIASGLGLTIPDDDIRILREYAGMGAAAAASRGEWLCARLMARVLGMPFVDAADVFAFNGGLPDERHTYENIRRLLKGGGVVPGFYGRGKHGNIAVFPRGGSDICGAYAAAALMAEAYENWTDVDGIYTADPVLMPGGHVIAEMSYRQAALLTSLGASVLHSGSVYPAERAGIPIYIRNSFDPEKPGTRISASGECGLPCAAVRVIGGTAVISVTDAPPELHAEICALPGLRHMYADGLLTIICPKSDMEQITEILRLNIGFA